MQFKQATVTEGNYDFNKQTNALSFHNLSQLYQSSQCLICFDKMSDAVIMECGHGGICRECAEDIWKKSAECYLCRKKITSILILDLTTGVGNYKPVIKQIIQSVEEGSFIEESSTTESH